MNTEKGIQIYIRRGEERLGPFSWEEIRSKLESGELEPREPAWHAALPGWSTLGTVLNTEADRLVPQHSQAGIVSAVLGGLNLLGAMIFLLAPILMDHMEVEDEESLPPILLMMSIVLVLALSSPVGLVLGFVGSFSKTSRKKGWAWAGLVVNGIIFLAVAGIIGFVVYDALTIRSR